MKIKVEVTDAELEEMGCESAADFKRHLLSQLDEAVGTDDGGSGSDWLCGYTLDVHVREEADVEDARLPFPKLGSAQSGEESTTSAE